MGSGGQHQEETQALPSPPRHVRHHHRRRATAPPSDTGLDLPPSVSSPSGQARKVRVQTSQHICTLVHPNTNDESSVSAGTAPCNPLICFDRYLVSATNDGRLVFYQLSIQQKDPSLAVVDIGGDEDCTIIGLVAGPTRVSLVRYTRRSEAVSPPDLLGHVVAVTSEGDVYILECTLIQLNLEVKKVHSWNTGTCNPSCVTVRLDRKGQWRICLGYHSGLLEEWLLSIPLSSKQTIDADKVESESKDWKPLLRRASPRLLWRGAFQVPINSISSPGQHLDEMRPITDNETDGETMREATDANATNVMDSVDDELATRVDAHSEDKTKSDSPEEAKPRAVETDNMAKQKDPSTKACDFIAMCLVLTHSMSDESLGRPASCSQVEVINVTSLEQDWNSILDEQHEEKPQSMAMTLDDYCVWPDAGMEIMDTASLPAEDTEGQPRLSRRIRALPSQGSDRLCSNFGANACFAAALSDGTVALMHATINDNNTLCWGVACDGNQLVLSYPAIGIAPVELDSGPHMACCLRGGSVYLVPESEAAVSVVTAILPPVDTDEQSTQYIQGFTAGNAFIDGLEGFADVRVPIVVYSGPCGILSVYACTLLSRTEKDRVLQEAVENGTLKLLWDLLSSMDNDNELLQEDMWKNARQECQGTNMELPTRETLKAASFASTRLLLLELCKADENEA